MNKWENNNIKWEDINQRWLIKNKEIIREYYENMHTRPVCNDFENFSLSLRMYMENKVKQKQIIINTGAEYDIVVSTSSDRFGQLFKYKTLKELISYINRQRNLSVFLD